MTRVFLDDEQITDDRATVRGGDAHHLLNVLRMAVGDEFTVVDERGRELPATIERVGEDELTARLGPPREAQTEPRVALTLYHGLPRASRYETSLRMCTELGVARFVPVLSARSVIRLDASGAERKCQRWSRIVLEAARQCGRTEVPEVVAPLAWEESLGHYRDANASGLMPSAGLAGAEALPLGEAVDRLVADGARRVALFIGPESGFDLSEEAAARDAGVTLVTLGPRVLRTETAAVVAAAICLDRAGDLGAGPAVH